MIRLTRREFLFGALGLSGLGLLSRELSTSFALEVTEVRIANQYVPKSFNGYRIGLLSDIHLSRWFPPEYLEETVKYINSSNLDLLILGGDYLWVHDPALEYIFPRALFPKVDKISPNDLGSFLMTTVSDLLSPVKTHDGIYAVLGNHDHWYLPPSKSTDFASRGISLLVNNAASIKRDQQILRIFGIDDYWTGAPKIPSLAPLSQNEYRVVVTHNPDLYRNALLLPQFQFNLGLAGHTHGGQIRLPVLGAPFYNIEDLRFKCGLARVSDTLIYTTRGIGAVELPLRMNCPPEFTVLTLSA